MKPAQVSVVHGAGMFDLHLPPRRPNLPSHQYKYSVGTATPAQASTLKSQSTNSVGLKYTKTGIGRPTTQTTRSSAPTLTIVIRCWISAKSARLKRSSLARSSILRKGNGMLRLKMDGLRRADFLLLRRGLQRSGMCRISRGWKSSRALFIIPLFGLKKVCCYNFSMLFGSL